MSLRNKENVKVWSHQFNRIFKSNISYMLRFFDIIKSWYSLLSFLYETLSFFIGKKAIHMPCISRMYTSELIAKPLRIVHCSKHEDCIIFFSISFTISVTKDFLIVCYFCPVRKFKLSDHLLINIYNTFIIINLFRVIFILWHDDFVIHCLRIVFVLWFGLGNFLWNKFLQLLK